MPAKVKEIEKVAKKLGFIRARQKGSHARWKYPYGTERQQFLFMEKLRLEAGYLKKF